MADAANPFAAHASAWITAFWRWEPERWGCVGWTFAGSRASILDMAPDPFLCVIYTTKSSPMDVPNRGRVMGVYELSHEIGHRDAFTRGDSHAYFPERWQHAARALRAWECPDRPPTDWLEPRIYEQRGMARTAGIHGVRMSAAGVERARSLHWREVGMFRPDTGDG